TCQAAQIPQWQPRATRWSARTLDTRGDVAGSCLTLLLSNWPWLEAHLRANLEKTSAEDLGRREPRWSVARVDAKNRTGVQDIVQIELPLDPCVTYLNSLRQPRIELIDASLEFGLRLENVGDR